MDKSDIKRIVKDNKAGFWYYRQQHFYYVIYVDNAPYIFPIPLEDLGDASLNAEEKAIHLMRYIRKAIEDKTFVRI